MAPGLSVPQEDVFAISFGRQGVSVYSMMDLRNALGI